MKNKNNYYLWVKKFGFYTAASTMTITIALSVFVLFAPYLHDKLLADRSILIICKLKEHRNIYQKLPDSISQIMKGDSWWNELNYINENNHDFTLSISNGFDSTAIYSSVKNKWDGPDIPFVSKQEFTEIDCH
jgi:hypothetical protein